MWSKEDIQFLRDNPEMSLIDLAQALKRSVSSVRGKRSRLQITTARHKSWTRDERRILQLNYSKGRDVLVELLPGRTWAAIYSQAHYLRKRQWNL